MKRVLVFLTGCLVYFTAFPQTEKIEFAAPKLYPEGVAFDAKKKVFYVSSVTTGTIGVVDEQGNYTKFYQDSTLKSSFGMKVDNKRNRLWVCSADPNYSKYSDSTTFKKMARVIAIDLTSGEKVASIDLSKLYPGKHFANDLALDDKGNLYITDSFAPVIFRIDQKDTPSILTESPMFKALDVGLNGIAWNKQGFLIVVNNNAGSILKVDLKNPKNVTRVKTDQFFPGADGLLFDNDNNLILVQNKGVNKAFRLRSSDNWASAKVTGSTDISERFQNPTTATNMNDDVFVLNSKMDELMDSTRSQSATYSIQRADFGQ